MKVIHCLILLLKVFIVEAQHGVSGTVADNQRNSPISNASLFFPELSLGIKSQVNGEFSLSGIPAGQHLLEISHIGYRTVFYKLLVPLDSPLTVRLEPSTYQMQEVVIAGATMQAPNETTLNVSQLSALQLKEVGALNLSDAMSQLPGVTQLTTGPGISKPVIRGLSGNRIQVIVDGLRFDNQQWQDEHGLGLSDIGVERIDLIKGPASVLYGSDALGGVINIVDERPAPVNTRDQNVSIRSYSNTYGVSLDYGIKSSSENKWKKFRAGIDSHADYTDGKNNRILNSRFSSFNCKLGWGKNMADRNHSLNLTASHGMFGFVFDSLNRKEPDNRISRSFDGPYHSVSFLRASSENTYFKNAKIVKFNLGAISNLRLENEGGGGISLSMLLNSANALLQVHRIVGSNGEWTYGGSLFGQTNTNFGGRIIIPDALTAEASLYNHYKYIRKHLLIEGGVRYDKKLIETFPTRTLNVIGNGSPTEEIVPFTKFYNALNFSSGVRFNVNKILNIGFNASTGYRPGNLAELSSNGLHEGTLRWEIGLSDAKIEQNLNIEGTINYTSKLFRASVSGYNNYFKNFFYLAPTGEEFYGFNIYRFRQSNAKLSGGEVACDLSLPGSIVVIHGSYSVIRAEKNNGQALPSIPANKLASELTLKFSKWKPVSDPQVKFGVSRFFKQDNPAEFESYTGGYTLFYASAYASYNTFDFFIRCNNVLNTNYFDHLSRYKYYGFLNMGRSVVLGINLKF